MSIVAIDPGNVESAYVVIDGDRRPETFGKLPNREMFVALSDVIDPTTVVAIEMIASYGMPVGAEVFSTCVWIGRFVEHIERLTGREPELVFRVAVKVHHCHSAKAKDSNITQALIDRFAPGVSNKGKGTKAAPGWFFGFHSDIWQAFALAVYVADTSDLEEATA